MDQFVDQQFELANLIAILYKNLKKLSRPSRTDDRLIDIEKQCNEYWKEFKSNHEQIVKLSDSRDQYVVQNHYKKTEDIVKNVVETVKKFMGREDEGAVGGTMKAADNWLSDANWLMPPATTSVTTTTITTMTTATTTTSTMTTTNVMAPGMKTTTSGMTTTTTTKSNCRDYHFPTLSELNAATTVPPQYPTMNMDAHTFDMFMHRFNMDRRLPKMKIPKFSGKYQDWRQFHDIFKHLVHDNQMYNGREIEKLTMLKEALHEDVKLIDHITITNGNYAAAWELLVNRFNNTRVLVKTQIDKLLELEIVPQKSSRKLKEMHDTIREIIANITNLGVNTESWDAIITNIIMRKLDYLTLQFFEDSLEDPRSVIQYSKLMNFIERRFMTLENMQQDTRM